MAGVKAVAGVARAPFLLLPFTLVAAGATAAAYEGSFDWARTLVALAGLVAAHVAVNALNEWSDMRSGIDLHTQRTPFSGGSGTVPTGAMSVGGALAVGVVGSVVALAAGIWLATQIGLVLVPFIVVGAVTIVFYTPIMTRIGIGEVAAGLGLGGLPVVGVALVQGGTIGPAAIAAGIPATLMTFNLLLLNEFPDEEADRRGGRRHLVIAIGRKGAAAIYAVAGILTPVSIILAVVGGLFPAFALAAVLPSLLLLAPVKWAVGRPTEPVPLPALGANVGWNLLTNAVLAGALAAATLL